MTGQKKYEVFGKEREGKKSPTGTLVTYRMVKSHIWADSPKLAEMIFEELHPECDEIFRRDTKEIEPTAEELAERILKEE